MLQADNFPPTILDTWLKRIGNGKIESGAGKERKGDELVWPC